MKKKKTRFIGSGIEFLWLLITAISLGIAFYELYKGSNEKALQFFLFSPVAIGMFYYRKSNRIKRENTPKE